VMSITHNTSWFKTFIGIVLFIVMLFITAYINGEEDRMRREEAMRAINSQRVVTPTSPGWDINDSEKRMKRDEAIRAINSQRVVNPTSPGWDQ
ncbi:MAG: hypothetical protein IJ992_08215, partial [Lentisphaeria bacterium]|nr:hypothetical protein [Lentisphaeria bacterium]